MKDEMAGQPILEFVGLRPKMYSILEGDGEEKKKAKGIAKRTTAKLRHQQYITTLFNEQSSTVTMQRISSAKHDVYTVELTKIGLSPYDDKRYVLSDKISTLAHGHFKACK
jgi:hypothetical protein